MKRSLVKRPLENPRVGLALILRPCLCAMPKRLRDVRTPPNLSIFRTICVLFLNTRRLAVQIRLFSFKGRSLAFEG
jgi:hypothetical protein